MSLPFLVQDGRAIPMGLHRHHDIHSDLTMRRGLVADQGDRPQRRDAHRLRLPASGELTLFRELGPSPVRLLQLPLNRAVELQLLVPHPAHEIDAIVLFEFAKQIRPPVAAIQQQNLQPTPQWPHGVSKRANRRRSMVISLSCSPPRTYPTDRK